MLASFDINNLYIAGTKFLHMAIIGFTVFIIGSIASKNIDRAVTLWTDLIDGRNADKFDKLPTWQLLLSCFFSVSLIYATHWGIRNTITTMNEHLIPKILFWVNNIGYDTHRLKSLGGGVMVAFSILNFNDIFKERAKYLFNERLSVIPF